MFNEVKNREYTVVVFGRKDCNPCHALCKYLDGKVNGGYVYIDVDNSPDIVSRYGITSVPTVIVFKMGQPYSTEIGQVSAERLNSIINEITQGKDNTN